MEYGRNPLTGMDFPDPDVIRVEDTYYMISTTMHFFPGGQILRSFDLIHWEHAAYVFDALEHTPGERLENGETIYGHGMWAASLRYHKGTFYVVFIAHEWDKTFLFTADKIEGPWKKSYIEGIYHDPSLFFDDDGRVYIVYGNRDIHLTELRADLSGPKQGGFDRVILKDAPGDFLGYEGSHLYRIGGKYVLFLIHSRQQEWYRTQACFVTEDLGGIWAGGDVMAADLDGCGSGPAQGGIVDTPDGRWFSVVFQDRGAVGRIPVLVPVTWNRFGYPVFGPVTKEIENTSERPGAVLSALYDSDDFTSPELSPVWQFNHEPAEGLWETGKGYYRISNGQIAGNLLFARNTITQRTLLGGCRAEVTVDAGGLEEGDVAGLCLLIAGYGYVGIAKKDGKLLSVMKGKNSRTGSETVCFGKQTGERTTLRATVRFSGKEGIAEFFVKTESGFEKLGPTHHMEFTLEHFTGCRFGLFCYATQKTGGHGDFYDFRYLPR